VGEAVGEIGRAVERIDDPERGRSVPVSAAFFGQDGVPGERSLDRFQDERLGLEIGLRDQVDLALVVGRQAGVEVIAE